MLYVIIYSTLFSIVTVISILLTGSRSFISGQELSPLKIVQLLLNWHFILGAGFAFMSRLFFIMINNSLLKMPNLANSSTTITMFISNIAMIFIIAANYYFLGERINLSQGIGAFVIIFGIFLVAR